MLVVLSVAMLAVAGAAFAYFTSTGAGNGSATVGSSHAFNVVVAGPTGGPLYPNSGSENLAYTVTNPGPGNQNLASTSAKVVDDGAGNIKSGGVAVPGCLSKDFTAKNTSVSKNLKGGESISSSVEVTMQDSGASQDECQGKSPEVTVEAK